MVVLENFNSDMLKASAEFRVIGNFCKTVSLLMPMSAFAYTFRLYFMIYKIIC